ncbi:transglycosylase domain-containing protein [Luteococcus sp. OSA5]|uniref:transglycosylase domain-containing protein n=1 Tax=Luteococcus sp. OSA5 TaxID=3401630 RepID=UPI003B4382AE
MTSRKTGTNAYHLGWFAALSVICGLLVAGLVLPFAWVSGSVIKASADSLESLPAELEIGPQSERSKVLMSDGSVLAEFYAENRVYVPLNKIAKVMQQAQIAIEDHRFYEHGAIDFEGTARAAVRSASGTTQGGSTLTQQYVKQVQVETAKYNNDEEAQAKATEQTLSRKIRELRYAVAVEKKLTKDQILERYLNIAYYGDGAYGVEAAAKHYFNTTAAKLTLPQAAMLAGLVQNPAATDPVNNPTAALNRRNIVLNRMVTVGDITKEQADAAKKQGFDKSKVQQPKNDCTDSPFQTMCQYVKNVLLSDQFKTLGKTKEERLNTLQRGGLTIQTLIDPQAQAAAEKAVARRIAPTDPFISTSVLVQPKTGLIVAMAQNRTKLGDKPGQTWYNYSVNRSMGGAEGYQAGSTFKTFTVAAAIAKGIPPTRAYNSPQTMEFGGSTFRSCDGPFPSPPYRPKNSTGAGHFTMEQATMRSINTYFVQLQRAVGNCDVVKMAQAAGVERADGKDLLKDEVPGSGGVVGFDNVVSFTLGPVEVTPLSMAQAYATFANRGVRCDPIIIKSVKTKAGKQAPVPSANCKRTIDPEVADQVNKILKRTIESGTARPAYLPDGRDQAAKTGTTDSAEAVWLAGYTPDMAAVAMIAADKQAAAYKGKERRSITGRRINGTDCTGGYYCTLSGSGSGDAGKIWRASMQAALDGTTGTKFNQPSGKVIEGKKLSVPNLNGLGMKEAMAKAEAAGFTTEIAYQHSGYSKGTYLYAWPNKGTHDTNKPIVFYVSQGPRPRPKPTYRPTPKKTTAAPKPTVKKTTAAPKPTATKTTAAPKPAPKTTAAPKPAPKTTAAPKPAPKPAPKTTAAPKPAPKPAPKTTAAPKPAPKTTAAAPKPAPKTTAAAPRTTAAAPKPAATTTAG